MRLFQSPNKDLDAAAGIANGCLIAIVLWILVVIALFLWYWLLS